MRVAWKVVVVDESGRRWSSVVAPPHRLEYSEARVSKLRGTPGIFCYSSRKAAESDCKDIAGREKPTVIKVQLHGRVHMPRRIALWAKHGISDWMAGRRSRWFQPPDDTICADAVTVLE